MHTELNAFEDAFHEVAFDAGRVLLGQADAHTKTHYVNRYNELCTRLRRTYPTLHCRCRSLSQETPPGHVRLAARDVAFRIRRYRAAASLRIQRCAA